MINRIINAQIRATTNTFFRAQEQAYNGLLDEIDLHDYTTISEVKGAIKMQLDSLNKLKGEIE